MVKTEKEKAMKLDKKIEELKEELSDEELDQVNGGTSVKPSKNKNRKKK